MNTRRSVLFTLIFGTVVLVSMACSGGNPNVSAAEDAIENQNYEQALTSINTAIEEDTTVGAEAYMLKARILRSMADSTTPPERYSDLYRRAEEAESMAVQMDPSVRSEVTNRNRLAFINQMQDGADAFNRARQESDSSAFIRAASYFNAAGVIFPDSSDAHLNEGYARLNAGQRIDAIPSLEKYSEVADTVDENVYQILGQLYLTNDREEDALDLLEEGTQQYPDNGDLQSLLLNAYNQAGATERAMKAYQSQIDRDPDNATYRYNYGSLLLNQNKYQAAAEQLEQAAEIEPDNVRIQYNLGAAHVNRAVALNDSIAAIEDEIREADREATDQEEETITTLAEERQQEFQTAIPPLETARQLAGPSSEYRTDICRALFTSYVQTEQQDKASEVEECAGYSDRTESGSN